MGGEAIRMQEAGAIIWTVRRASKNANTRHSPRLLHCDNTGVVLAFEHRRAHLFPLPQLVRLFCVHGMASGSFYSIRWNPSEANSNDLPSHLNKCF